ncbi:hypothetical protein OIU84_027310 [Salix udensis]|uniref:Uncharacterized protein n=1 Tax=Salix udensis TaxID=889485 RepID=A0AAD6KF36_9ROSI|nr:hypothetical protein OIU84_027310 [Salix udensis]
MSKPVTTFFFFIKKLHFASSCFLFLSYIPDEDVRFILCAPNFGAAGLPRPLPAANGLALVVGGGAAMEAQGSSSSSVVADLTFKGLVEVFGAGAAIEPHKSSSSSFVTFTVLFGRKLVAEEVGVKLIIEEID